jgi:hypothetical protein
VTVRDRFRQECGEFAVRIARTTVCIGFANLQVDSSIVTFIQDTDTTIIYSSATCTVCLARVNDHVLDDISESCK